MAKRRSAVTPRRDTGGRPSFTADQAAAFRLARHHLAGHPAGAPVSALCADTGGIQAQLMSAAELALWARGRALTRRQIQAALWERRDVVKTSAMRATLHLIAARDFAAWIAALKAASTALRHRVLSRIGVTAADVARMNATLMDALVDGPRTQQELLALARVKAGTRMRLWLDHAWSAVRPAIIEGLICHGPPRGSEVTFVRVDKWLGVQPHVEPAGARAVLLRRFLAAFGPASPRDFSKWSGLAAPDAKATWTSLGREIVEVRVDGASGWMLARDLGALAASELDRDEVRLLGAFDPLLLAHATKEHLVDARHYKRVYRSQGWISPVVLVGGRVAGVWSLKQGRPATIQTELFERTSRSLRARVEDEAETLGGFLGVPTELRFA